MPECWSADRRQRHPSGAHEPGGNRGLSGRGRRMIPLLAMKDVSAGYVEDIDILRRLNLGVAPGAITGLIGLNGAGKSTIMKTICGFLHPRLGTIAFDGIDIRMIAPHRIID